MSSLIDVWCDYNWILISLFGAGAKTRQFVSRISKRSKFCRFSNVDELSERKVSGSWKGVVIYDHRLSFWRHSTDCDGENPYDNCLVWNSSESRAVEITGRACASSAGINSYWIKNCFVMFWLARFSIFTASQPLGTSISRHGSDQGVLLAISCQDWLSLASRRLFSNLFALKWMQDSRTSSFKILSVERLISRANISIATRVFANVGRLKLNLNYWVYCFALLHKSRQTSLWNYLWRNNRQEDSWKLIPPSAICPGLC